MNWYFKVEKKEELLQGRTITYLVKNYLKATIPYITDVLNGKRSCSYEMASMIVKNMSDKEVEDYFYKRG